MSILTSVMSAFFILFNLAYNVLIYPGPDKLINYTEIKWIRVYKSTFFSKCFYLLLPFFMMGHYHNNHNTYLIIIVIEMTLSTVHFGRLFLCHHHSPEYDTGNEQIEDDGLSDY